MLDISIERTPRWHWIPRWAVYRCRIESVRAKTYRLAWLCAAIRMVMVDE